MTQIELRFMEVVVRQLPLITKELHEINEQLKSCQQLYTNLKQLNNGTNS